MADEKPPCHCFPTTGTIGAKEPFPPKKIALPDGMLRGVFTLSANSGEELGREVDNFLRAVDYDRFDASTGYVVSADIRHIRAVQSGIVQSTFGPFWTEIELVRH